MFCFSGCDLFHPNLKGINQKKILINQKKILKIRALCYLQENFVAAVPVPRPSINLNLDFQLL